MIAVYDEPFRKDLPREGVVSTPAGVWMMDNSDIDNGVFSLIVFLGGPIARQSFGRNEILSRVAAVVGPKALNPVAYHDQAWLPSPYLPGGYESVRAPGIDHGERMATDLGRIFLAGTESSDEFSGYVEGALASAERAVSGVMRIAGST